MPLHAAIGLFLIVCHCTWESRSWGHGRGERTQPPLLAWSLLLLVGTLQGLGVSNGVSIRVIVFHYPNQKGIFFFSHPVFQEPAGERILFALLAHLGTEGQIV